MKTAIKIRFLIFFYIYLYSIIQKEKRSFYLVVTVCFPWYIFILSPSDCCHFRSKGCQGQLGDLKELLPEGNTDDGNAPEAADQEVDKGHPPAEKKAPDDIDKEGDRSIPVDHFLSEGEKGKRSEFKALQAVRDANKGQAPEKARQDPCHAAEKASEYEP